MEYTTRPDLYDLRHFGEIMPGEFDFYDRLAQRGKAPVIELGFGSGRVGVELARRGRQVVGVDRSQPMLDKAPRHDNITLVKGSFTDFTVKRQTHLVYIPFSAFLHLTTQEDQRACLRQVRKHLEPGGIFAGSFFRPDPQRLAKTPFEHVDFVRTAPSGERVVQSSYTLECDLHEQTRSVLMRTEVFAPTGEQVENVLQDLEMTWIFGREWRLLLELEGFRLEELHGGFRGEPIDSSWMYVWVATATDD